MSRTPDRLRLRHMVRFVMLLLVLGLIFVPDFVLPYAVRPLIRDSYPEKNAGAIVVLSGNSSVRPVHGARAVLDGYADHAVMIRCEPSDFERAGLIPNESDIAQGMAARAGLAKERYLLISDFGGATSTFDEARSLRQYFKHTPRKHRASLL